MRKEKDEGRDEDRRVEAGEGGRKRHRWGGREREKGQRRERRRTRGKRGTFKRLRKAKLKQADREGWGEGGLGERRERRERRRNFLPSSFSIPKRARYFLQLTSKIF